MLDQPTVHQCCSGGPTGTGGSKVSAESKGPGNGGGPGGVGGGAGGSGGFGPGGNSGDSADGGGRGRMQPLTIAFALFVLGIATLNACFACWDMSGCLCGKLLVTMAVLSTQICVRYNSTLLHIFAAVCKHSHAIFVPMMHHGHEMHSVKCSGRHHGVQKEAQQGFPHS